MTQMLITKSPTQVLVLTYTITPGLTASITHNDYSARVTDAGVKTEGDNTALALDVSF